MLIPATAGFIESVSPNPLSVSIAWTRCYDLAWPLGFVISAAVHIFLNLLFPPAALGQVDEDDVFGTFTEKANTMREDPLAEGDLSPGWSSGEDHEGKFVTMVGVSAIELGRG